MISIQLILGLVVVGVVLWVINTYIPMARSIKTILNVVVVVFVVLYLLRYFGVVGPFSGLRIGSSNIIDRLLSV